MEELTGVIPGEIWTLQPPPLNLNESSSSFIVARHASEALSDWLVAHLTITTSRNWGDVDMSVEDPYNPDPSHHEFEK